MGVEENKAVIQHDIEELYNKGDLSVADEILAHDFVRRTPSGELRGPEATKQIVKLLRTAFPDFHCTIDDMVAEGDKVAVGITWTGTHKGDFMGIPPTGKKIKISEAIFYRFENGKEVELRSYMDVLDFYQQLGVTPPSE